MAETTKLSVGKALDKMRSADAPGPRGAQLDAKIGELDAEIVRLRAARNRVERDQRAASARGAQGVAAPADGTKQRTRWILVATGLAVAALVAALFWKLF